MNGPEDSSGCAASSTKQWSMVSAAAAAAAGSAAAAADTYVIDTDVAAELVRQWIHHTAHEAG